MHGMISSAIQQALSGGPTTTQGHANLLNRPQVQVDVGPPLHLPLGPPQPPENRNAFDPFLPCSSHHIPGRGQARLARMARSATDWASTSRSSSLPRRSRAVTVGQTPNSGQADRADRLASRNSQADREPVSMEVSPPHVPNTDPAPTRTISMMPPPDLDQAFPSSLLAVPSINSPTMSTLSTALLPIIARDQAVTDQRPHSDLSGQPSKKRRLNTECKPTGQVRRVIKQSLQQAFDQTVQPTEGAAVVMEQVVASSSVQEAIEQMARESLQERSMNGE